MNSWNTLLKILIVLSGPSRRMTDIYSKEIHAIHWALSRMPKEKAPIWLQIQTKCMSSSNHSDLKRRMISASYHASIPNHILGRSKKILILIKMLFLVLMVSLPLTKILGASNKNTDNLKSVLMPAVESLSLSWKVFSRLIHFIDSQLVSVSRIGCLTKSEMAKRKGF